MTSINKKILIKNYIKKNNLFLFIFINYFNINELTKFNPLLKNKNFKFLYSSKVILEKLFINSIYVNFKAIKSQTFILISFKFYFFIFKIYLDSLYLELLVFKLNKKIYNIKKLTCVYSFYYKNNKLLLFKFCITNLKIKSK